MINNRFKTLLESKLGNVKPLLVEQSSGDLVDPKVYDAISKIESVFSFMRDGNIQGASYTGREKESNIRNAISSTIGLDNWSKLSPVFRGQIYSYMFQSDSGNVSANRWLAGLANAIDPNFQRLSIINSSDNIKNNKIKTSNDPQVANAINIIQTAINNGKINEYYDNYKKIVDQQYKSSDYNNNYTNIWRYRPTAIERLFNGEDWEAVKKDWYSSIGNVVPPKPDEKNKVEPPKPTDDSQKKTEVNQPSQITTPPGVQLKNKPMSEDNKKSFLESFPCLNDLVGASYREIFNRRLQEHEPIIITRSGENYLYHYLNGTVLEVEIKPENNNVPKTLNVGKINCE